MCYMPGMTYAQLTTNHAAVSTPVHLRIYVHIVRYSDGSGGQSIENVMSGLCNLRQDFAPHDIYFDLQSISYIDDDQYYDFDPSLHITPLVSTYGHSDRIDIFLYEDNQNIFHGGTANGFGTTTYMFVGGTLCEPTVKHHVISHEMAHITSTVNDPYYVVGTAGFLIDSENRTSFQAEAGGNISMEYGDVVSISAQQINEAATYNWYNTVEELVRQGSVLSVSPEVTETYKLEVITDADGYIDYDEVQIEVKPYRIESINPNPVSSLLTIQYQAKHAQSVYFMLVEQQSSQQSSNYIAQVQQSQAIIDVSNFPTGHYTLAMVYDGKISDAVNLIIQ